MKNLADPQTFEGVDRACFLLKTNYRCLVKGPLPWKVDRGMDTSIGYVSVKKNLLFINRNGVSAGQYEKCD